MQEAITTEAITLVTSLLNAIGRVKVQQIFERDPYESRRAAMKGSRLLKVLVFYQLLAAPSARALVEAIEDSLDAQSALGGTVARNTLSNALSQREPEQMIEAWAVLLDINGNLCEGMGSNIFTVRDGQVFTPREKFVLPGVSRQTVIDLAKAEGIPLHEADIDLYDAYNADEAFLTSTSLCICPVTRLNGVEIGPKGQMWGPMTQRLADGYRRLVDHDFVGQYLNRHVEGMQARAF